VIDAYLSKLPEEKRKVVKTMRALVRKHLPKGYAETFEYGMPCYVVPLSTYPDTHNGKPLWYAGIAAQKNHYAFYLVGPYQDSKLRKQLEDAFKKAGKKLDMGKSCLRFKQIEDVPLDAIAGVIAALPVAKYIAAYEKVKAEA
jgi:hypothetical protein